MSLPVFHADPLPVLGAYRLAGAEGRHAATVRRLHAGEDLELTDGRGGWALARVTTAGRDALDLAVRGAGSDPCPVPRIVLVQALAKGDRGELAVALATEVGVDEIVPWSAERCVARWSGDRGVKARARWESAAAGAAKQSRRHWWPVVAPLASTVDVAQRLAGAALPVVLHEGAAAALSGAVIPSAGEVVLVVGPEGGLTDAELTALGSPAYRAGPGVFRTSSAGAFAAAALLARTPRWA